MAKIRSYILCIILVRYGPLCLFENKSVYEPQHEISNNVVSATSKGSDQPAHMRSLIRAFASRLHILCVLIY